MPKGNKLSPNNAFLSNNINFEAMTSELPSFKNSMFKYKSNQIVDLLISDLICKTAH